MRKRRKTIAMGILFIVLSFPAWTIEFEKVAIRVPERISRELQRYDQARRLYWVGVNWVLYSSRINNRWESTIFDIRTGEVLQEFEESPYRINRVDGQMWFRSQDGSISMIPLERDPEDINPPEPINLVYRRRGAMGGQSTIQIRQIRPDGSVIDGEWYNDRETARELGFIGDIGHGGILDMLPDGRTVLLAAQFTYIATIENLRIVNLSRIEAKSDVALSRQGSFFVDDSRILTTTLYFGRGPVAGIDGPGVVYPVLMDFEGNVLAEFRSIEIPTVGYIDYDSVRKQIVVLELTDDRYASSEIAVYRLVE